jgi:hypothetical protein
MRFLFMIVACAAVLIAPVGAQGIEAHRAYPRGK